MALDIEKCKGCYYADEDGVCKICCVENAMFEPKRPNERITEWISVKDRLPKKTETVLCWKNEYGCFVARYIKLKYTEDWYEFVAVGGGVAVGVTHWMPLPNPPKEE